MENNQIPTPLNNNLFTRTEVIVLSTMGLYLVFVSYVLFFSADPDISRSLSKILVSLLSYAISVGLSLLITFGDVRPKYKLKGGLCLAVLLFFGAMQTGFFNGFLLITLLVPTGLPILFGLFKSSQ